MPVTLQPTTLKYKTQEGTFQSATCLKGDSYTLTAADKAEIAAQAAVLINKTLTVAVLIGAADAYMKGDKVSYNNEHYISDIDNNVWAPSTYGWSKV